MVVGYTALILSLGMMVLYLPGSPSALLWPHEWVIFLGAAVLGVVLYAWARVTGTSRHDYSVSGSASGFEVGVFQSLSL